MSSDPEQEYFADGITEDIITELSRFKGLMVIARNSTFTYKNQAVDVKKVGIQLGVKYVLEGSVRRVGPRVRITAQLIEAHTGGHVWAERYDRELIDIFELQDEITKSVVATLQTEMILREEVSPKEPRFRRFRRGPCQKAWKLLSA
jgi:adenylate cyclase